jgi:hypothetical protein
MPEAFQPDGHVTDEAILQIFLEPTEYTEKETPLHERNVCQFTNDQKREVTAHCDGCGVCQHSIDMKLLASTATAAWSYRLIRTKASSEE